jgi:hypothetical protein
VCRHPRRRLAVVTLSKHTSIPFPVVMRLRLTDGSTRDVTLPVEVWARGDRHDAVLPVRSTVTGARLWPDGTVPDFNESNDVWGRLPPPADATVASTAGGLARPVPLVRPPAPVSP